MKPTPTSTVRDVVTDDFRAAAVFHGYGIDFCCGGKRTIAEACGELNLCPDEVLREVSKACNDKDVAVPRYAEWETDALIRHIVDGHHAYVRRALRSIGGMLEKLVQVHGARHPELSEVAAVFDEVRAEMIAHMGKEELVLFPYIDQLASAVHEGAELPPPPFGSIENPIRVMEAEHDSAGAGMALIRKLTRAYTPPEDGCSTYRACFQELEAFERDLHEHVHLENNILFPRARALTSWMLTI